MKAQGGEAIEYFESSFPATGGCPQGELETT
jgi:hypothetical protein